MNRATLGLIVVIVAVVIVSALVLIPKKPYYTEDPRDWIEPKIGLSEVNIDKVTRGAGYLDITELQWADAKVELSLAYDGLYEGNYFINREYYDEAGELKLAITPKLIPNNGILEGVIIERFEPDKVRAYIFIDEDWKTKLGQNINIIWGKDYQNIKKFAFNQTAPGIYFDQIIDDERFSEDFLSRSGGIVVGNANLEDVQALNEAGLTVMRIY